MTDEQGLDRSIEMHKLEFGLMFRALYDPTEVAEMESELRALLAEDIAELEAERIADGADPSKRWHRQDLLSLRCERLADLENES